MNPAKFLLVFILATIIAVLGFHYFLPLRIWTTDGKVIALPYDEITSIEANDEIGLTQISIKQGEQHILLTKEPFNRLKWRAGFNKAPYNSLFSEIPTQRDHCYVGKYDLFNLKGFIQLTPQMFVAVMAPYEFEDCPCDDKKVFLNKNPKCPVIYNQKKKQMLNAARSCGLGDYFPVLRCR